MGTHSIVEAIVLRTVNIGEADRFCILLTQKNGRLAARARGARRVGSRMGPLLLPGRCLRVELQEGVGGYALTSAIAVGEIPQLSDPGTLAAAEEGIETILALTEDGEPMPEIFALLYAFLGACVNDPTRTLRVFQLRLLHLLGLLPAHSDDARVESLSPGDRTALRAVVSTSDFQSLHTLIGSNGALASFLERLLDQTLPRVLKSTKVAAALR